MQLIEGTGTGLRVGRIRWWSLEVYCPEIIPAVKES